ncbi:MAG: retroviral-like aspartic protease family protein, partial [Gallionella sp.]
MRYLALDLTTIVLMMLVCIPQFAIGQTYKCIQSGQTTYSSDPCGNDAQLIENHVSVSNESATSITLVRDATGRFSMPGSINGLSATFTVDTGASATVISGDIASKLGIHSCMPVGVSHT